MSAKKTTVRRKGRGTLHVELAPNKVASRHADEIAIILEAVGHPEALVTDGSRLSDFHVDSNVLAGLRKASGKRFGAHARLVDVAEAMRKQRKSRSVTSKRRSKDERD